MWAPNSRTGSTKDAASLPRVETPCQDTAQLKKRPNSGANDSRSMFFQLVLSKQFEHYTRIHFVAVSNRNNQTVRIVQNQNITLVPAPTSEILNVSVKHSKNLLGFSGGPPGVLLSSFRAPFGLLLSSS